MVDKTQVSVRVTVGMREAVEKRVKESDYLSIEEYVRSLIRADLKKEVG